MSHRYHRGYDDSPGMEMMRGVQMFGNAMQMGQRLEQGRMALEDEKGVNAAYEHIASKVGHAGDISALDGDPIMNTRHGTMAAGRFLGQRAQNETSRLQMLKAMSEGDDEFYRNTFRPLAFAADEAFKAGDMQRFGAIASELSTKAPLPYRTEMDQDGSFRLLFRSDQHGGWTDTGRRLSAQEVMQEISGIIGGEQKILAGAGMQTMLTNPRFLAAAARYRMATIQGNAEAMADLNKYIPMQKGNHLVWAIPQNRHDDYSAAPSYRIVDESGKMGSRVVSSLNELMDAGYTRADATAKLDLMRKRAAMNAGASGGGKYTLTEGDRKFIDGFSTTESDVGGKIYNAEKALALETLMSVGGLSRQAAVVAYNRNVENAAAAIAQQTPGLSQHEVTKAAEKAAQQKIFEGATAKRAGSGGQKKPVGATPPATRPSHPQDRLHGNIQRAAGTQAAPSASSVPIQGVGGVLLGGDGKPALPEEIAGAELVTIKTDKGEQVGFINYGGQFEPLDEATAQRIRAAQPSFRKQMNDASRRWHNKQGAALRQQQ